MKVIVLTSNSSWYLLNFRRSTIKYLLEKSYKVICIAPKDEYSSKLIDLGAEFHSININRISMNPIREILVIAKLIIIFVRIKPYLIFSFTIKNNIYGSIASFITRNKIINNVSGLGSVFINNGPIAKLILVLYRILKNVPVHSFCQNKDDYDYLLKNRALNKEKSSIIPGSGVNTSYFKKTLKAKLEKSDVRNFIFVGRLIGEKGVRELADVFFELYTNNYDVNLTILGINDTSHPSGLSIEEINSLEKMKFIKMLSRVKDIRNYLEKSDCFVLPSYREGLSRATLEAMSMELPIICTNVPGLAELVEDGKNGFLCEPYSRQSLKGAVMRMIATDPISRINFGKKSREIVKKHYDEAIVVNSIKQFL
jgi:glycosyltransferase involved in cell wall biosynthesis